MVVVAKPAVFLLCLLAPSAAHLKCGGDDGGVAEGAVCDQEGRVCGRCHCSSFGRWVCEPLPITAKETRDKDKDDDDACASIEFHKDECNDWQEGKRCGDCTCASQQWICSDGLARAAEAVNENSQVALRQLQISDEECQAISKSNEFELCTEEGKICGNCICYAIGNLFWICPRPDGGRFQQCLGVEDGKFCRWIERGEKCGDCECMPNNRWACPASESSKSFCDQVDNRQFCRWADRGLMCGTCFCSDGFWNCPETLCNNIFPSKFCLWKDRGRNCFGCECVANRWVCPETTPTRQELCADDIFTPKVCRWRDEGRRCGECVCKGRWRCLPEQCPRIGSCSGEQITEVSAQNFDLFINCTLPAGLRGLEIVLEEFSGDVELELYNADWIPGDTNGEAVLTLGSMGRGAAKEFYEQDSFSYANRESPGRDQLERNISDAVAAVTFNPDFPSKATVYGYEMHVTTFSSGTSTGTLMYRLTCNEDPALACDCALG